MTHFGILVCWPDSVSLASWQDGRVGLRRTVQVHPNPIGIASLRVSKGAWVRIPLLSLFLPIPLDRKYKYEAHKLLFAPLIVRCHPTFQKEEISKASPKINTSKLNILLAARLRCIPSFSAGYTVVVVGKIYQCFIRFRS